MTPFTTTSSTSRSIPEPAAQPRSIYAALDPVVQAVLTDENADIDALLERRTTPRSQAISTQASQLEWHRRRRRHRPPAPSPIVPPADGRIDATRSARSTSTAADARPAAPRRRARRSPGSRARRADARSLFLLPMLLVFGVFSWWPIVRAVVMSVQETNLVDAPTWVGLDNFRACSPTRCCRTAVPNTLWFALLALVFGYPDPAHRGRADERGPARHAAVYSALAYLPVVIPPVVAVLLWKFFYDAQPDRRLQHDPRLGRHSARSRGSRSPATAMPSLVLEATWAAAGATVIIYLAALSACRRAVRRGRGRRRRRSGARSGTSRCRSCAASCSSR